LAVIHILKVNRAEMAGDKPSKPANKILSIKRRFQRFRFDFLWV